ncbi:MAG: hypothetical protein HGA45_13495 [Chloroflexales bacterium]|nr:hypothetical protein [Chloroflexales bacterium]
MSNDPEQIGPLVFVESPDYPYPFEVERPPRFWMEETTGMLAATIEVYMRGERLEPAQVELIKLYLRQYLERAVIAADADRPRLLGRIERLRTVGDVERLADSLSEAGVEPF